LKRLFLLISPLKIIISPPLNAYPFIPPACTPHPTTFTLIILALIAFTLSPIAIQVAPIPSIPITLTYLHHIPYNITPSPLPIPAHPQLTTHPTTQPTTYTPLMNKEPKLRLEQGKVKRKVQVNKPFPEVMEKS
jgi:hypothetical protein